MSVLTANSGQAQQPATPPAAQAQQPSQDQIQLIYIPWIKICTKGQEANAKQVCFTSKDGRLESGQPVVAAVIMEQEGAPKKILRVTLPLGMQIQQGTQIVIDSTQPVRAPFSMCVDGGCLSDYEATPEIIANLKKGQTLFVQAINANGAALTLTLPLAGEFAKAYDGKPSDPKTVQELQQKQQEEAQRRIAAEQKRLEAAQKSGIGTSPAAK